MNRVVGMVSVITINMNQNEMTAEFLKSLKQSTYTNLEVIVVDHNSKEDPEKLFKEAYPEVILVKSKDNLGFTGGNNLAVKHSKGEYIFCVNNDTIVPSDLIEKLVKALVPVKANKFTKVGIASPRILYYENPSIIQYAGYTSINIFTGRNKTIGQGENTAISKYKQTYLTEYAHGCAMMIPYKVIDEIGFLDDDFFIYYEELDFSQRVQNAGYSISYNGDVYILHKESMTVGKNSVFKEEYHTKNRIFFMRKHSPTKFALLVYYMYFALLVTPKKLLTYTLSGQFKHIDAFIKGVKWNLKHKI